MTLEYLADLPMVIECKGKIRAYGIGFRREHVALCF